MGVRLRQGSLYSLTPWSPGMGLLSPKTKGYSLVLDQYSDAGKLIPAKALAIGLYSTLFRDDLEVIWGRFALTGSMSLLVQNGRLVKTDH
jgi:hypothetical protein